MLCECKKSQATIHEVIIQDGHKVQRHLCQQCASKLGVSTDPHMPISQLISNYISGKNLSIPTVGDSAVDGQAGGQIGDQVGDQVGGQKVPMPQPLAGAMPTCSACSMTYAKFKDTGLLGCPGCYKSFQDRLTSLIARAHEGGEQHIGKVPRRAFERLVNGSDGSDGLGLESLIGEASEREQGLAQVRKKLANAVEHEDYEQAAMLRDEITRLASQPCSQIEARAYSTDGSAGQSEETTPEHKERTL